MACDVFEKDPFGLALADDTGDLGPEVPGSSWVVQALPTRRTSWPGRWSLQSIPCVARLARRTCTLCTSAVSIACFSALTARASADRTDQRHESATPFRRPPRCPRLLRASAYGAGGRRGTLLNQWQFDWLPAGCTQALGDPSAYTDAAALLTRWSGSPEHDTAGVDLAALRRETPWARGPGRCLVHVSADHGLSFGGTVTVDTAAFSGGYGMRGAVEAGGGRILLPLSDVPHYRTVFIVESEDGGRIWGRPLPVAFGEGHEFEEPAILRCQKDRLILVLRDNVTRRLHQCLSTDDGRSWSAPEALPVTGYPADLLRLVDGRILLTYGWRQPGFGIRAVLSEDDGATWQTERMILIRDGMRNRNLGYPLTLERDDDSLLTLYYGEDDNGVTSPCDSLAGRLNKGPPGACHARTSMDTASLQPLGWH